MASPPEIPIPSPSMQDAPRWRAPCLRRGLLALGVLIVALGAGLFYLRSQRFVATDDAYIRETIANIAPQVSGTVAEVLVHENQVVHAGDVLIRLDARPFRLALEQAEASLANTAKQVEALRATWYQRRADFQRAQSDVEYYERELARQKGLIGRGFTSRTAYDSAKHEAVAARQRAVAAQQAADQAAALLNGGPEVPLERIPMYVQALAQRDQARLNLAYTRIVAPFDGVVAQVEGLAPGDAAVAGRALCALVDTAHPWVEANYKETQLTHVQIGYGAEVRVDTYPDAVWHAGVESISPAAGSEFSLLPPENASGNWVKVVQRVKVRLWLDPAEHPQVLRSGMSVTVRIDTGRFKALVPG